MNADKESHLPRVWQLKGDGTASQLDQQQMQQPDGNQWIELDEKSEADREWLGSEAGIGRAHQARFLRGGTWPVAWVPNSECLALHMRVLRAADPYREPDRYAMLRIWIEPHRIITVAPPDLPQLAAIKERLENGTGPGNSSAFLLLLIEVMANRLADAVMQLRPNVLDLEYALEQKKPLTSNQIHKVRRRAIELQRYADPQRALLLRLHSLELNWLVDESAEEWRAVADYYVEGSRELDAIVDHTRLLESSLANLTAEQMNRRIYVLTLVSTLVLPLSLISSVFAVGIGTVNGNIMGLEHPLWFLALCFALFLLGAGIFLSFRRWWPVQNDEDV